MSRNVVLIVALLAICWNSNAAAQDSVLAELYGQGVHHFFANRHEEAHRFLTMAIEQKSQDPRVHYYRGLAHLRLGRPDEAKADFEKGAELETSNTDRIYPVSRSLQRVQGRDRLALEDHRRSARLAARIESMKVKQARYEELQRSEERVVRDPNQPAPAATAEEVIGEAPPASDPTDPFAGEEPAAEPAQPKPAPSETPMPAETPAPGANPMPMPTDDPFGGSGDTPAPANDDPFGGSDTPAPANDDPFGGSDTPAPANDDPFGGTPGNDDPFGGTDTPAETPGTDDPFADDPFN